MRKEIKKIQTMADEIAPLIPYNEEIVPGIGRFGWNGLTGYTKRTIYQSKIDYFIDWCTKRYEWMNTAMKDL